MKTILSLVALLAATTGLRGQGGVSADDSGPESGPGALREWSAEEADALLSGPLAAYDDSWEALSRFRFSFVRYAPRGYDRSRSRFLLAGVDLADPATGAVRWGAMTALREARVSGAMFGGVLPGASALGPKPVSASSSPILRPTRGAGASGGCLPSADFATACAPAEAPASCAEAGPSRRPCRAVGRHDARIRGVYSDD
ncbi:MAG: hypothetical protein ACLR76_05900 [Alistipes sp.]